MAVEGAVFSKGMPSAEDGDRNVGAALISIRLEAKDDEMYRIVDMSPDAVPGDEPIDSVIRPMAGYWHAQRRRGQVPRSDRFPPDNEAARRLLEEVTVIDVGAEDPANFTVVAHRQYGCIPWMGRRMAGKRLAEFPSRFIADVIGREYHAVRSAKQPRYQETDQIVAGVARHYARLLLPLADADGAVTRIIVASRCIHPPFLLEQESHRA